MTINRRTVTIAMLRRIADGARVTDVAAGAVELLKRSNQLALLPVIITDVVKSADISEVARAHKITVAHSNDIDDGITEKLLAKYAHNAEATDSIIDLDESLIGGFMLECGDMRYDYSIRGLVEQLRRHYELTL